jgi:hypothetical protein
MAITLLPVFPVSGDPDFETKADAWAAALPQFVTEANAVALAMNLNSVTSTSTSSVTLHFTPAMGATTDRTFTVDLNKSFLPGMYLVIARTSAPANHSMVCQVLTYNSATGLLTVNWISSVGGLVAYNDWSISLAGIVNASAIASGFLAQETLRGLRSSLGTPSIYSNDNVVLNGSFTVDVRNKGAAKSIVAGATAVHTVDRFYASCAGANITVQQVVSGNRNALLITWPNGCTSINLSTRILSERMQKLWLDVNGYMYLKLKASTVSAATSLNWSLSYPGTKNAFGTLGAPTVTLGASSSFGITSTPEFFDATINNLPALAAGALLNLSLTSLAGSGTLLLEDVYLGEDASRDADFIYPYPDPSQVNRECEFFCREFNGADGIAMIGSGRQGTTTLSRITIPLGSAMFKAPTPMFGGTVIADIAGVNPVATLSTVYASKTSVSFDITHAANGAVGQGVILQIPAGAGNFVRLEAEV